jgi:nucleoside-diphosphate-sugar epimerase
MDAHQENGLGATVFRLSTIYGASLPSAMHFKIFVNLFVLHACKTKQIKVFGGANWRPLLYVGDVAKAFLLAGESPLSKVSGEIFNLGCSTENYTIRQVADVVAEEVSGTEVIDAPVPSSPSSYKVSFEKIENMLQFKPDFNLRKGVRELRDSIFSGQFGQIL